MKRFERQRCLNFLAIPLLFGAGAYAETNVSQEIVTGVQYKDVNSPEAKFEEYGEVPNGIFIERYDLFIEKETSDTKLNLTNVRQDNQSATLEINGPKAEFDASWNQTPHLFSNEAQTPYNHAGKGEMTLPDQIQSDIQTGGASQFQTVLQNYLEGFQDVRLKTQTNTGDLGLAYKLSDVLKLDVGLSETIKKGTKAKTATFSRNSANQTGSVELPQPIDYKVYNSNVGLGFAGQALQMGIRYNFSTFQNQIRTLTVENPLATTDTTTNASKIQVSLAPNSAAHTVGLDGGYDLSKATRLSARVVMNYLETNETLLPLTSNSAIATPPGWAASPSDTASLPVSEINAKMVTWTQNYGLTSQLGKKVDAGLRFDSYQLSNKTPEITFPGIAEWDSQSAFDAEETQPHHYNFRKDGVSGDVGWRVLKPVKMIFGYGVEWVKRDHRTSEKQRENTASVKADVKAGAHSSVRASFINARRRMSDFQQTAVEVPGQRQYDVADRDRNEGSLAYQITRGAFNVGVDGAMGRDKYKPGKGDLTGGNAANQNQMYGLLENRTGRAGVDLDWDVNETLGFFTFYNYQQDRGIQRSNQRVGAESGSPQNQDAPTDWTLRTVDKYNTVGAGIDVRGVRNFIDIRLGYDLSSSRGNTDVLSTGSNATVSSAGTPPGTKSTKQDYYIEGEAAVRENLSVGLGYIFEKFDVFDWANDNIPVISPTQRVLYIGDSLRDYKAHIVTAKVNYKF